MEYNPFFKKYEQLEETLTARKKDLESISKQLEWYKTTSLENLIIRLEELNKRKLNSESLLIEKQKNIKNISNTIKNIERELKSGFNPLSWFNEEQKRFLNQLKQLTKEKKVSVQSEKLEKITISKLSKYIISMQTEIEDYRNFGLEATKKNLSDLNKEINSLELELAAICKKKEKVDNKLKPIIKKIDDYEHQVSENKINLNKARSLENTLKNASNSRERWEIHEECDKYFSESKPGKVVKKLERKISTLERNLEKIKSRARKIAELASRFIEHIIIDGNNMCYQSNEFIGLPPLIKLTDLLQKSYDISVVFDASIRSLLGCNDENIKNQFNQKTYIHIVANKQSADETILELASNKISYYIISNDRFAEYYDKEVINDNRLIRHEIIDGKLMIHDLDIKTNFEK